MLESHTSLLSESTSAVDLAELGERLTKATGGLRIRAVSWHDADGLVLWSSQTLLGIEQREAIRDALESFSGVGARMRVDRMLGDGQTAVLLRASDRTGNTLGFAMLIVDSRALLSKGRGADMPVPALQIVHEFGRHMASVTRHVAPVSTSMPGFGDDRFEQLSRVNACDIGPETDREHAVLRDMRLALHVQPLVALRPSARVRRYEVLLRSQSEDGDSQAAPIEILESAAEKGLGTVIDRRVVNQLIAWLRKRSDIVQSGPCLFSVNLSATALQDEHFLKFVELCLEKAALPRGLLGFEIQASALTRRRTNAQRVALALQAIGCGLVIDDFAMTDGQLDLLRLPGIKMVKLSPALTDAASNDVFAQAMVAACAQIARVCGFFTVAKRVETELVRDHCRSLGIDFVQGFAFGSPAPIDSIVPLDAIDDTTPEAILARSEQPKPDQPRPDAP